MYFQRRRGQQVIVYYRAADGKLKTVPRRYLRHLDHEPDHNVQAWINGQQGQWEATANVPRNVQASDSKIEIWIKEWGDFREKRGFGTKNTVTRACHALREDVAPFFMSFTPPIVDAVAWPSKSFGLVEWQERQGISEANRIHARTALRKFWKWLGDTRRILPGLDLPLDFTRRSAQATTLAYSLTPDQILEFARQAIDERMRLMALVGYFASLRPQELFALRRSDFFTGSVVEDKECCHVMTKCGLFGKMAVDIHRQRRQSGEFEPPKAFSKGLVAVFDEQAAKLIRTILLGRDKDALLFDYMPNWNAELWKRGGIQGLTLHDLRKASIYWLGHHGGLELIPLKNHARHAKVETTMLYCRRPLEQAEDQGHDLAW